MTWSRTGRSLLELALVSLPLTLSNAAWAQSSADQTTGGSDASPEEEPKVPDDPEPPEPPAPDPAPEDPCKKKKSESGDAESALFVHPVGAASYPRHQSMLDAAVRTPQFIDDRVGATAEYRTTPALGMSTMADDDGRSRFLLQFHVESVDAQSFHPSALNFNEGFSAEYIYRPDGSLRQVITDDTATDITLLGAGDEGYLIRSYRRADQLGSFSGGVYTMTGSPYLESRVFNPTPGTYTGALHVRVVDRYTSSTEKVKLYTWDIDPVTGSTLMLEQHRSETDPTAFHTWRKVQLTRTALPGGDYEQIREVSLASTPAVVGAAPALSVVSRDYERYTSVAGEKRLTQLRTAVTDSGASTPETTTTNYEYFAPSSNGYLTGRPKSIIRSDGMWWMYEYDHDYSAGTRTFRTYTPFLDAAFGDLANSKAVVVEVDGDAYTSTTSILGTEIAKEVRTSSLVGGLLVIKTERGDGVTGGALVSFAAYDATSTTLPTSNRIHSEVNEDGSVAMYTFVDAGAGDGSYIETVERGGGTFDATGVVTSVATGTRVVTLYNAHGEAIEESTFDIESGLAVGSWSAIEPAGGANPGTLHVDAYGRPTRIYFNGDVADFESQNFNCCGFEDFRDRTGATWTYSRDALGRLTSVTMAKSSTDVPIVRTMTYSGRTVLAEESAGANVRLVQQVTRSLGGEDTTIWSPDADGAPNTLNQVPPPGYPNAEYSREVLVPSSTGHGMTALWIDPDGVRSSVEMHRDGRSFRSTSRGGRKTTFEYGIHAQNGGGEWVKEIEPITSEWTKTYSDRLGREFKTEYADGATDAVTFHGSGAALGSRGQIATQKDADETAQSGTGELLTFAYHSDGERASITESGPDGHSIVTAFEDSVIPTFTASGETLAPAIRTAQSVNGVEVEVIYSSIDGRRRARVTSRGTELAVESAPIDGRWTLTTFAEDGQESVLTFENGRLALTAHLDSDPQMANLISSVGRSYDGFGQLASTIDSRTGTETISARRANGTIQQIVAAGGSEVTSFEHDAMGRIIESLLPDGTSIKQSYTLDGELRAEWGDETYPRMYRYDSNGRQIELRTYKALASDVEPTEATTGYASTTWHYSAQRGWLIEQNFDGEVAYGPGAQADYAYTPAGRMKSRTWERGVSTTYGYDAGYIDTVDYSDSTPDIGVTYNPFGLAERIDQGGNRSTFTYDSSYTVLREETVSYDSNGNGAVDPSDFSRTVDHSYGAFLRPLGYTVVGGPSGVDASAYYTYDNAGRIDAVMDRRDSPSWQFTYDYTGGSTRLVESITGPVHTVTNVYDPYHDRLKSKENKASAGAAALISKFAYTWDTNGRLKSLTTSGSAFAGSGNAYSFDYNDRGELIEANDAGPADQDRAYEYDGIGNRKKAIEGVLGALPPLDNYYSNSQNQYTGARIPGGAIVVQHDEDGNVTEYKTIVNGVTSIQQFDWDAENRLVAVTQGGVTTEYGYDFHGRRITIDESSGGTKSLVYDGWNVIAEYDGGVLDRSYNWGLDVRGAKKGAGGVGALLAVNVQGASVYFPTYDANGNVSEYLRSDGAGVAQAVHYEYDTFGKLLAVDTSPGEPAFAHRFSTKWTDESTGFYDFGFRAYDPSMARWMSRDPMGEQFSINRYGFLGNDPTADFDVLGLYSNAATGADWWLVLDIVCFAGDCALGGPSGEGVLVSRGVRTWVKNRAKKKAAREAAEAKAKAKARKEAAEAKAKAEAAKRKRRITECTAIHAAYKALEKDKCKACTKCMKCEDVKANIACWSAVVAGRQKYLDKKCDDVLPAAVAAGSRKTRARHKQALAEKKKALKKCNAALKTCKD